MKSRSRFLLPLLAAVMTLALALPAFAAPRYVPGELLVKFKPTMRSAERTSMRDDLGGSTIQEFSFIGVERMRVQGVSVEEAVARLKNDPRVEYAEPNWIQSIDVVPNDPRYGEMWQLHNTGQTGGTAGADIKAQQAWDVFTGDPNIMVGVIDTGVDYTHEDLVGNVWTNPGEIPGNGIDDDGNGYVDDIHGYDFVNNDGDPMDDHGHGSHCSGTIAANGNNGIGITGINWHAKIVGIKFLNAGGSGSTDGAIAAVQYAIAVGVKLTSNSWGGGGFSQALLDAINAAGAANQLFVAASGNSGVNTDISPQYPAAYDTPYIVSVAATDHNDELASFSNFGLTTVDLGAPGVNTLSCEPGNQYQLLSGTSMACPHVSGACALLWGRFPGMTNLQVKNRVMMFADPIPALAGKCVTGGRLNLFMTIADPDTIPPGSISDLNASSPGSNSMGLTWTATGDDGNSGRAANYDIRYSTSPITPANFGSATPAGGPNPQPAGSAESFSVGGLATSTLYYFALKAADEFGNAGPMSNLASGTTLGPPDISVTPSSVASSLVTGGQKTEQITISNNSSGTLDWSVPTPELQLATPIVWPYERPIKGSAGTSYPPQLLDAGGPDGFGYRWSDSNEAGGPTFAWIDITGVGTLIPAFSPSRDDGSSGPWNIGFSFPFYGGSSSTVRVATNGFLSFTDTSAPYQNVGVPNSGAPASFVGPMWDDFDLTSAGQVFYHYDGSKFIVEWVNVPRYSDPASVATFEAILYPSGEIRYQYLSLSGVTNSATVGIQNQPKNIGLNVAFNQAYLQNNLAVRIIPLRQWLTVTPNSGHLGPNQSALVDVGFNANGLNGGVYHGTVHVLSNDPDTPDAQVAATLTVTGAPDISVAPDSIDFGTIYVGAMLQRNLTVHNDGTDPLHVTNIVTGDPVYTVDLTNFTLAPGGSQVVIVSFSPTNAQSYDSGLSISSDDPDENPLGVQLHGVGTNAPEIDVEPSSLNAATANGIGPAAVAKDKTLIIHNHGGSDLTWTASTALGVVVASTNPPMNDAGVKGAVGQPGSLGSGGPDAGGYRWIDSDEPGGPVFSWVEISGVGTPIGLNADDQNVSNIPLPFAFPFYGNSYNTVNACSNGWLSFTATTTEYTNAALPNTGTAVPKNLIAPFWDDLDFRAATSPASRAWKYYDGSRMIFEYQNVPHYSSTSTGVYTFEVILYPNGTIEYQYLNLTGEVASNTIGIQNGDGSIGLPVVFNAAYVHNNLKIRIARKPDWFTISPAAGTLPSGTDQNVTVHFSAAEYDDGDYNGDIRITSNDVDEPLTIVPTHMHVGVAGATIAMIPHAISSVAGGPLVTLDVDAPGAPEDIVQASLLANGGAAAAPGQPPAYPGNGHALYKFAVLDLLPVVAEGKQVPLTLVGEVADQTWFSGTAPINVIKPEMIGDPLPQFGSTLPTVHTSPGHTLPLAWKDPKFEQVDSYSLYLSFDRGQTWTQLSHQTTREYAFVVPSHPTDGAMIEIVAMFGGQAIGSWLSKPFVITDGVTAVDPNGTPTRFALEFAGSNPARGSAQMRLALPKRGAVEVRVIDVRGAIVRTLARGTYEPGMHPMLWDGADQTGRKVGSGVYFIQAVAGGQKVSKRLALIH